MIQTVLKRDGRVVGFNEEKIVAAVRRAMLHTDKGEDMQLAHRNCRSYRLPGTGADECRRYSKLCGNRIDEEPP